MKPLLRELPPNCTMADLDAAYGEGLLRKEDLVHGQYYRGTCRNAGVARWHAKTEQFVHVHIEFGQRGLDSIRHPVDEQRYDAFLVVEVVTPAPGQEIPDAEFDEYFTRRA